MQSYALRSHAKGPGRFLDVRKTTNIGIGHDWRIAI